MRASIVDLRYRMKHVLEALNRNESVTVLYHGQEKAVMTPLGRKGRIKVTEHPFFGMNKESEESVEQVMERLRKGRYS
jgi:PHD/YefM family antitoxin component YafN of YafNO toxin-antitoxin module